MKNKCVKIFHLKYIYIGQPVSDISKFLTCINVQLKLYIVSYS